MLINNMKTYESTQQSDKGNIRQLESENCFSILEWYLKYIV